MADTPGETHVLDAVVSLVDSLLDSFDVVDLLNELTERCATLFDVSAAGLLLADPLENLHLLAGTSDKARDLELFQIQADEGPCLECFVSGQPVSVADLGAESRRWRWFVPAAVDAGFASVHAMPMRAAGTVLGALGLLGTSVGELSAADLLAGPEPRAHRVRGEPAGTCPITVGGRAAIAQRTRRPAGGLTGQGIRARATRRVG